MRQSKYGVKLISILKAAKNDPDFSANIREYLMGNQDISPEVVEILRKIEKAFD